MNKALAIFLLLAGLVAIVRSADVPIMVGNDDAAKAFTFTPETANAKAGDTVCIAIFYLSFYIISFLNLMLIKIIFNKTDRFHLGRYC